MVDSFVNKSLQALRAIITKRVVIECDLIPYHYHDVPLKKLLNWIRTEAGIALSQREPWGWPTHLQIEPANLCNLKCALCPIAAGMHRTAGHMSLDMFRKVIDELDHTFLNDMDYFKDLNPSSENIARYIFKALGRALDTQKARVSRVTAWESDTACASYTEP